MDNNQNEQWLTRNILGLLENKTIPQGKLWEFVERDTYLVAMKFTGGNQVQATNLLGVSRGTLRTKLQAYFGTTHIGGRWHGKTPHLSKNCGEQFSDSWK